jgi:hypothetical protein
MTPKWKFSKAVTSADEGTTIYEIFPMHYNAIKLQKYYHLSLQSGRALLLINRKNATKYNFFIQTYLEGKTCGDEAAEGKSPTYFTRSPANDVRIILLKASGQQNVI